MSGSQIGVYGLGVMGRNLALHIDESGFQVSVFNRMAPGEENVVQDFVGEEEKSGSFLGTDSLEAFISSLETPRKILVMIKSGKPVNQVIDKFLPLLDEGDELIDRGNSHYKDTDQPIEKLGFKGIHYVGMGVSGGEKGGRFGADLMPGGNNRAWPSIRSIFEKVAATAFDGSPCCTWVGDGGAGHCIKIVHNGIEYADMQLLAETYHIMKVALGITHIEVAEQLKEWNDTSLNSYLIEITLKILAITDEEGEPLVEKILDSASEKGTGKWTAAAALKHNIPLPGISQAVYAWFISNLVGIRNEFSAGITQYKKLDTDRSALLSDLKEVLLASRISEFAEGFYMITSVNKEFGWNIHCKSIAKIWQGACIIRSVLLKKIEQAYENDAKLSHLFLSGDFVSKHDNLQNGWKSTIKHAVHTGIPIPCMTAYLILYDSLRTTSLSANLIHAQRDYFGAHTYERIDKPRGQFFHTDWQQETDNS